MKDISFSNRRLLPYIRTGLEGNVAYIGDDIIIYDKDNNGNKDFVTKGKLVGVGREWLYLITPMKSRIKVNLSADKSVKYWNSRKFKVFRNNTKELRKAYKLINERYNNTYSDEFTKVV